MVRWLAGLIGAAGFLLAAAAVQAETALNLESLVAEALRSNPEILAARSQAAAAREKVPQAYALEDPMLALGVTNLPTNFSFEDEDMTQKEISVTQKLPFPGKRGLMRDMAQKEAEAAAEVIAATENRVANEVKSAYFELSHAYRALDVTRRNKQTVEGIVKIAEARYGLGEGSQSELLAAQVEITRMLDELIMLDQNRLALEARMESLLDREPTGRLGRPAPIGFNKTPIDTRRLQQAALQSNPTLKSMRTMVEARRKAVELSERDVYPDFEVRLSYGQRDSGPDGQSRRDMLSGMVGFNVPIFFGSRQGPKISESRAEMQAADARYAAMKNEVLYRVANMAAMADRQQRQIEIYDSGILPQTRLQAQSAMSAYAVNKSDFAGLLESHIRLHRYELDYHQALTDFEKSLAALEAAVGGPVRTAGGAP